MLLTVRFSFLYPTNQLAAIVATIAPSGAHRYSNALRKIPRMLPWLTADVLGPQPKNGL